jgi:hypothetical protein
VRIEVIRAFIKIGDPVAGQYLIPIFHDSTQKVRTQAMVAAGLLKFRPAVAPLLSVYGLGPEKKGSVTTVTGAVKGVFTHAPRRDEAALWALSLIGDERAEQTFVENIDDKNAMRRQYAFDGLARIAEKRYMDQISQLVLREGDADVKLAQHWALYRMGSRPNIQYVIHDLDTDRAQQAHQYLMETEDPSDLYPYIQSSSKVVRRKVIEILGRIGDQATIKELEPVARSSGRTSDIATLAIKRIEWRMNGRPLAGKSCVTKLPSPRAESVVVWTSRRGIKGRPVATPVGPDPTTLLVADRECNPSTRLNSFIRSGCNKNWNRVLPPSHRTIERPMLQPPTDK